jgi:hypothetical protein
MVSDSRGFLEAGCLGFFECVAGRLLRTLTGQFLWVGIDGGVSVLLRPALPGRVWDEEIDRQSGVDAIKKAKRRCIASSGNGPTLRTSCRISITPQSDMGSWVEYRRAPFRCTDELSAIDPVVNDSGSSHLFSLLSLTVNEGYCRVDRRSHIAIMWI